MGFVDIPQIWSEHLLMEIQVRLQITQYNFSFPSKKIEVLSIVFVKKGACVYNLLNINESGAPL